MYTKGVSIFTGLKDYSQEENLKYLHFAKKLGYEIVFSSAHITEAENDMKNLQVLLDEINKLDMKLSLDISKKMYDQLALPNNLYALRLDYGFSDDELIKLTRTTNYKIEINASTFSKEKFNRLVEMGLDTNKIRASFNYYPKLYTAHSIEFCKDVVEFYHQFNVKVTAFIPSKTGFRPPMYEGLPSVEQHRKMPTSLAIEELKAINIDEIIYGDAYASREELEILKKHQTEELNIEFIPYLNYSNYSLIEGVFRNRPDLSPDNLRVSSKRSLLTIEPFNTMDRKKFDVTIDNKAFLRYQGEINIVLRDLPKDERVNVIGRINITDVILNAIINGNKFKFIYE